MLLKSKKDDPTDQIFVFFPEGEKVGVKEIRKYAPPSKLSQNMTNNLYRYCIRMKEEGVQRALIIIKTNLTAIAKQVINHITHSTQFAHNSYTTHLDSKYKPYMHGTQHELIIYIIFRR
jgi:hypothetical protein